MTRAAPRATTALDVTTKEKERMVSQSQEAETMDPAYRLEQNPRTRPTPYIGVTGFMSQAEVCAVLAAFPKDACHKLMVGVLMSNRTLAGKRTKYSKRYPGREKVPDIFPNDPRVLNLVHYHTSARDASILELMAIMDFAGPFCDGLQLNVRWPSLQTLEDYRRRRSDVKRERDTIVLQCGPSAIAEAGSSPARIARRVKEYWDLVDYVLIDSSAGRGEPFKPQFVYECFLEISAAVPHMNLVVAGGLGPESAWRIELLRAYPGSISTDAESGLRKKGDLDTAAAIRYVETANSLLRQPEG